MNETTKIFSTPHPSGLNRKQRRQSAKFYAMESRPRRIEMAKQKEFYRRNPDKRPVKVDVEVISGNAEIPSEVEEVENDEVV